MTTVTVTGTFKGPDGSNLAGEVVFTVENIVRSPSDNLILPPMSFSVPVVAGALSTPLYPGVYKVVERVGGVEADPYHVTVPVTNADLADLTRS